MEGLWDNEIRHSNNLLRIFMHCTEAVLAPKSSEFILVHVCLTWQPRSEGFSMFKSTIPLLAMNPEDRGKTGNEDAF